MTLAFLDIDLHAGEGARLLDAVRDLDRQLAGAASLFRRTFLIRSPWAPGLRFVGAVAAGGEATFSVGGAGLFVEHALISCLGEAAERLSQIERPGDVFPAGSHADYVVSPGVSRLCGLISPQHEFADFDWAVGADLRGRRSATAADWCLRRAGNGPMRVPGGMLSTGCAAGANKHDASGRALLELIERDAAALWWSGAREPGAIAIEGETARLLAELRKDARERRTWLLDISSDLDIPVVAALSCDTDCRNLAIGLGARIGAQNAQRRAILELCQMEIGLQLARLKSAQQLTGDDQRHLMRAEMDVASPRFVGRTWSKKAESQLHQDPFNVVVDALDAHDIDVTLVDLTRADIGISVTKAVAPDLQPLPGDIQTARLSAGLREHDGKWPPDVPLH